MYNNNICLHKIINQMYTIYNDKNFHVIIYKSYQINLDIGKQK